MRIFPNLMEHIDTKAAYNVSDVGRMVGTPDYVNCSFVQVPIGASTNYHNHKDTEIWLIVAGEGLIHSRKKDGLAENVKTKAGDLFLFESFTTHQITNIGTIALEYISIWWDDWDIDQKLAEPNSKDLVEKLFMIATPTPNGSLHLGHLSGPYFLADIVAKKLELESVKTNKVSGTFAYTSHITNSARAKNISYEDLVRLSERQIKKDLNNFGLILDDFIYHDIEENVDFKLFLTSTLENYIAKKIFFEKEDLHFFDPINKTYISEANIRATCSFCGATMLAIECETCGAAAANRALNATHIIHGYSLEQKKAKSLFWQPSAKSLEFVAEYYKKLSSDFNLYAPEILDQIVVYYSHHSVPISVFQTEGVRLNSYPNQTLSSFAQRLLLRLYWFEKYKNIKEIIFFTGKDNFVCSIFLFSVFLYENFGFLDLKPVVNSFALLDGKKFSTSQNHAIWAKDFFTEPDNADYLRLYFAYLFDAKQGINFSSIAFQAFKHKYQSLLQYVITSSLDAMFNYDKDIKTSGSWTKLDRLFFDDVTHCYKYGLQFLDINSLAPDRCFTHVDRLVHLLAKYLDEHKESFMAYAVPRQKTTLYLFSYGLWCLLRLLYPLMPEFSKFYLLKIYGIKAMMGIASLDVPSINIKDLGEL